MQNLPRSWGFLVAYSSYRYSGIIPLKKSTLTGIPRRKNQSGIPVYREKLLKPWFILALTTKLLLFRWKPYSTFTKYSSFMHNVNGINLIKIQLLKIGIFWKKNHAIDQSRFSDAIAKRKGNYSDDAPWAEKTSSFFLSICFYDLFMIFSQKPKTRFYNLS